MTLFFSACFFQKAGCPIFKNSGCRLTGRLGAYVHQLFSQFQITSFHKFLEILRIHFKMEKPTYLLECTPFRLVQKFLIQNGETMSRGCLAQNRKSVNASLLKSSFSLQKRLGKNLLRYRKSNTKHALNITLLASNSAPLRQPP